MKTKPNTHTRTHTDTKHLSICALVSTEDKHGVLRLCCLNKSKY